MSSNGVVTEIEDFESPARFKVVRIYESFEKTENLDEKDENTTMLPQFVQICIKYGTLQENEDASMH